MHLDTKEKPYVCDCGAAFARRDLLHRHERLTHTGAADARTQNNATPRLTVDRETIMTGLEPSSTSRGQLQTNAIVSNARVAEQHAEQGLVPEVDTTINSASDHALPFPPEYYHLGQHPQRQKPHQPSWLTIAGASFLGSSAEGNVLSQFNDFLNCSGLRQVAEGLHASTSGCDDVQESLLTSSAPTSLDPEGVATPPSAVTPGETPTPPASMYLTSLLMGLLLS